MNECLILSIIAPVTPEVLEALQSKHPPEQDDPASPEQLDPVGHATPVTG